jgi:hypothetical protein
MGSGLVKMSLGHRVQKLKNGNKWRCRNFLSLKKECEKPENL